MVTMKDVARRAGVSQSTVSHLLNGTRPVLPDTERAIRTAIAETGYVHDALARSLRTGTTRTVGVAITALSNPYFADFVREIQDLVFETGRILLLTDTADHPQRELEAVRQLLAHKPEGVLLAPAAASSPALDLLVAKRVPTVLVDRVLPEVPDRVDAAGVHNRRPMRAVVRLLVDQGHRSIALLAGLPGLTTTIERVEGYRTALEEAGGGMRPLVRHAAPTDDETQRALDELFAESPTPTAVVTGNNRGTIAAMRWLREHGLDVPDDVSLAGFDDFAWADLFEPRLTTVRQPIRELAETACALLWDRVLDPDRPSRIVRLEADLVVRGSTRRVG